MRIGLILFVLCIFNAICQLQEAAAQATSDVQITLADTADGAYYIAGITPAYANVGPTGPSDLDSTLTLDVGKRYKVTFANGAKNPFQLAAIGTTAAQDVVLASQGAANGSLESDPGVAWLESGNDLYFTLTESLAAAMTSGGKTAGYRSGQYPSTARGAIRLGPVTPVDDWILY